MKISRSGCFGNRKILQSESDPRKLFVIWPLGSAAAPVFSAAKTSIGSSEATDDVLPSEGLRLLVRDDPNSPAVPRIWHLHFRIAGLFVSHDAVGDVRHAAPAWMFFRKPRRWPLRFCLARKRFLSPREFRITWYSASLREKSDAILRSRSL